MHEDKGGRRILGAASSQAAQLARARSGSGAAGLTELAGAYGRAEELAVLAS